MSDRTTRDHIVEAADRLFYRRGYEHTSFSDIADVVQISRGNFYYHFKSKDEILDAVITARLANTREMLAIARRLDPSYATALKRQRLPLRTGNRKTLWRGVDLRGRSLRIPRRKRGGQSCPEPNPSRFRPCWRVS